MENLLLLLAPVAVSLLVGLLKKVRSLDLFSGEYRKVVLRFTVAILAFGAAVGQNVLVGAEVDVVSVESFVDALVVFLSSTGLYFFAKKSRV